MVRKKQRKKQGKKQNSADESKIFCPVERVSIPVSLASWWVKKTVCALVDYAIASYTKRRLFLLFVFDSETITVV